MKIAFISLGCDKNRVNTEQMMALCQAAGHEVTGEPDGADVAVVNTCGFIDSAKEEAIATILEGNTVTILEDMGNGWYRISFIGSGGRATEGYVSKDYIKVS